MVHALWPRANVYRAVMAVVAVGLLVIAARVGSAVLSPGSSHSHFACPAYAPLDPAGDGTALHVSNQAQLAAALQSARPGDTVNLGDGVYDELQFRADYGHQSGSGDAPIVIQAAPGASPVIDRGGGVVTERYAVSVIDLRHVVVRGLEIRHGLFGALASGSQSVVFEHNDIHHVALAGIVVNSSTTASGLKPSADVIVRCNRIHHTGLTEPEYGEGIYLGSGKTGAVDATTRVTIEGNEIYETSNEAIDVKRHVTGVTIRHNLIHDVTPYYGGAISLGLNKNNWGPANYLVEHNRIWAVRSGLYYAQAIAVAHGPTIIRNNLIWDIETNPSDTWPWTAPIQVHGDDTDADWAYGFGNPSNTDITISDNTVIGCRETCIASFTDTGQIRPRLTVADNIVDRPSGDDAVNDTDIIVSAEQLVGPTTGTADAGGGPGSGLALSSTSESTTPASDPPDSHESEGPADGAAVESEPSSTTTAAPTPVPSSGGSSSTSSTTRPVNPEPEATATTATTGATTASTGPPSTPTPANQEPLTTARSAAATDATSAVSESAADPTSTGDDLAAGPTEPKTSLDQPRRRTDTNPPPKPSASPNTAERNVERATGIGRPELQAMIERFARFEHRDRPLFDGPTPGRSGSALARSFGPT